MIASNSVSSPKAYYVVNLIMNIEVLNMKNIIKNQNNYLGYLSKKHTICAIGIISTILLFNNTAFSKEQDGKHNDAKTASEQQVMNNSNDNYFDDYRTQVYHMLQEMNKIHNKVFFRDWRDLGEAFNINHQNQTNISTDEKQYILNIDYPGFDKKELAVEVRGDYLIINGKKPSKNQSDKEKSFSDQEYRNSFQHQLLIPKDVEINSVTSSLKNGVLTVVLPRSADKKIEPKQIPIN